MKKLVVLLMTLALVCAFVLAEEAVDVTGVWYMVTSELDGVVYAPDEVGIEVTLTLNEDGTGDMTNVGVQTLDGTWTMEGDVVTLQKGDKVIAKYQYENGTLHTVESSVIMCFDRVPVASKYARPVGVAAEKAEDFYGIYQLSFLYDDKRVVPADVLGLEAVFMVTADGLVSMDDNNQPVVTPYLFAPAVGKLAVTDGVSVMTVQLNENGSVSLEQSGTMSMCLVPVTTAE